MNKVSMLALLLILLLIFAWGASAQTIRPPGGNTSNGGSSGDTNTTVIGHLELVATVIKNEKPEVSGNLFGELDGTSLRLLDSPNGQYGYLDITFDFFGRNNVFRYVLRNDLPQVQALGPNDVVQDTFHYQVITTNNIEVDAKLTIYILGNPSVSFDNVEIEFNNSSNEASPIHAGNSAQMGQHMRGQLTTSSDRDWFIFNSLGNEIINLELCPEGSQCKDEKAWVMYVFDADRFRNEGNENKTITLRTYIDLTNETLSTTQTNHPYLLHDKGYFNNSLIGIIDPCFGDRRTLDIGVGSQPKSYLVLITSPLLRSSGLDEEGNIKNNLDSCGSGDTLLKIKKGQVKIDINSDGITEDADIIEEVIAAHPYSDDQYTLRVTRTGADPFAVLSPSSVTFDSIGRKANVAKMRVNNQLYSVRLEQLNTPISADMLSTFGIESIQQLDEPLTADPYLPTYNPANQIVRFPQVLDTQSGIVYSVEMLYHPESNTLSLLKATPVN
ncbi:MAG TPA: hypothetical protein DEO56_08345 [Nitrosomonas nitrosa]|nr:hypothetical protein [Nitrosomonas nitrosa]